MKKGKVSRENDGFKVEFERNLDHNIETVWRAISDPQKMKYWFTDVIMDFKVGGKITFQFRDTEKTKTYGEIVSIEPPHRLVYTWEGERAEWLLTETGTNQCKLKLIYSRLANEYAINAPAGFHSLLDRLEEMLDGSKTLHPFGTEEDDPHHLSLQEEYAAVILSDYPELKELQPIAIERTYNAPVSRVWAALTDKEQMKQWYFSLDDFQAAPGFKFSFPGEGVKGQKYIHECEVLEAIPNKKLSYSWQYAGFEGKSVVTFELTPRGNETHLKLTHRGLHTFPHDNPDFAKKNFMQGWTEIIGKSLRDFLEK